MTGVKDREEGGSEGGSNSRRVSQVFLNKLNIFEHAVSKPLQKIQLEEYLLQTLYQMVNWVQYDCI